MKQMEDGDLEEIKFEHTYEVSVVLIVNNKGDAYSTNSWMTVTWPAKRPLCQVKN